MRVPVYEQHVVPQVTTDRRQVGVPEATAGVTLAPVDTSGGLRQGFDALYKVALSIHETRQKTLLASAVNEFREANSTFLNDKDSGLFARKGKAAFGASRRYEDFYAHTLDDITRRYKLDGAAKDRFMESTNALYGNSLASVLTHERKEGEAAEKLEWAAMQDNTVASIALNWRNNAACEEALDTLGGAAAQMWRGYGEGVTAQKVREARSRGCMARLSAMLDNEQTGAASTFLKAHGRDLTAEDLLKAQSAVKDKTDVLRVQYDTEKIVGQFGDDEDAALEYVRKHYSGDMENRLVSAVRSRCYELTRQKNRQEQEQARADSDFIRECRKTIDTTGAVDEKTLDGKSDYVKAQVLAYQTAAQRWDKVEDRLRAQHGADWYAMPLNERESLILKAQGVSEERRRENRVAAMLDYRTGKATADDVRARAVYGQYSKSDAEMILQGTKEFNAEQKRYFSAQVKEFKDWTRDISKRYPHIDTDAALTQFTEDALALDPSDPHYREKMFETMRKAQLDAFDAGARSGSYSMTKLWGSTSKYGKEYVDLAARKFAGKELNAAQYYWNDDAALPTHNQRQMELDAVLGLENDTPKDAESR